MADYASLVFLSYNRPQFIFEAIHDAVTKAHYPCELIVHDDGSTDANLIAELYNLLGRCEISRLILNPPGHNEGVGTAINRGFKLATGDPILKLDQDLLFTEGWLARAVGILKQDRRVGMLGLFKYPHEPVPWQRMQINIPTWGGYHFTRQFCGSGFAIPRRIWEELGPFEEHSDAFAEDMEYMERVRTTPLDRGKITEYHSELALPDVDLVRNRGFGIGPSTVVEQGMNVHEIHHGPFTFGSDAEVQVSALADHAADTHTFDVPMLRRQFDVGVVITTCAGREENLKRTIGYLRDLKTETPQQVVVVHDGCPDVPLECGDLEVHSFYIEKHQPGQEQPRNVGFRRLREIAPDCNYVWFLDGDLIVPSDTLEHFYRGLCAAEEDRVLIGPYDWLPPEQDGFVPELHNDPRWASFNEHGPEHVLRHDLGAALACFGGNLVWPVGPFERVGGFHPELHHGRCEDGELGLRACEHGIPMSFVRDARAWHVWHPVNLQRALDANRRDVPLLNAMHPWVQNEGLLVVDKDGKRFDWRCPDCDGVFNTLDYWEHSSAHR